MAPILHFVRHAQGFHNLGGGFYSIPDPQITPLGITQSEKLRDSEFPDQSNISLIMASPLSRALHTAKIAFGPALMSGTRSRPDILALPDAQETSDDPCDIGSDPCLLQSSVAENQWPVDLSLIKEGWNDKALNSRYSPASKAIATRARDTRVFIRQKIRDLATHCSDDNVHVVLVTHGSYLHYLTNDWEDASLYSATGWHNCETRSYRFRYDFRIDSDSDALLDETVESRQKRGRGHPMIGHEMQGELFKSAMQAWGDQGLQRPDLLDETASYRSHSQL